MVTIIIKHENGQYNEYKDVVAFDFYDKEYCEYVAERKLSNEELNDIENRMNHCEEITSEAVTQTVEDVINGR